MKEESVELQDYLKVIYKYRLLITLGTLACLLVTLIMTAYTAPIYEASLQLLVSQKQVVIGGDSQSAGEAYQAILTSERLAKTFSQMMQNRSTAEKVIEKIGVPISPVELTKKVKSEPIRDTQLIKVTVQDKSPVRAQLIANTLGSVFEKIVEDIEGRDQSAKSQQLVSISVVDPAIEPLSPVKPRPLMNAILGLLIGLIGSSSLAFLLSYMDMTVKSVDEAEQLTGLVSLGYIPVIQKDSEELILKTEPRSLAAEAFRMLRTNLQYINFESTIKTIIVTSAGSGEGKTLFCSNLAAAMATAGNKVLVVGCDLRRPRLHQVFGTNNDVGLANILIGTSNIARAIQSTGLEGLDVISSGPTPPNPVDLLESRRMQRFLEEAGELYDFIILDTPPITMITDALVLVGQSDGVIMLARYGVTNKHAFADAKAALDKVNARILGFALNATKRGNGGYGYYGYGYGYGYYNKEYVEGSPKKKSKKRGLAKVFFSVLLFSSLMLIIVSMTNSGLIKTFSKIF